MKTIQHILVLVCVLKYGLIYSQPCAVLNTTNVKLVNYPNQASYCLAGRVSFSIQTSFPLQVGNMTWSYSGSASTINTGTNFYQLDGLTSGGLVSISSNVIVGSTTCPFTRTYSVVINLAANAGPNVAVTPGQPQVTIGGSPASGSGGNPSLSYSWSGSYFVGSSAISNPLVAPTSNVTYVVTVTDATSCVKTDDMEVVVLNSYGNLCRSLDAGYYQVNNGDLYFALKGEYNNSSQLKYKIYDDLRAIRADYTSLGPSLATGNGDNRYYIDLTASPLSFSSGDNNKFFTLEVFNEKNELFLLKFKYAQ